VDKQKHNEKYCQKMVLHMVDVRLYDGLSGKRRITATQTPQQQKTMTGTHRKSTPTNNRSVCS
jgi:hypothetical protein